MPYLLEAPPHPTTIDEVRRKISDELADDLSKLRVNSEGYTEEDYRSLDGNYRVEFVDGRLQVLPMPDGLHNMLVYMLVALLHRWRDAHDLGGRFQMAAFKVKLREGQYREPDIA